MTGVNINKIRHYAPDFSQKTTRLDADFSAILFKAGNKLISSNERLIADISIKAALPSSADSDNNKRGLQRAGQSDYVNLHGIVFDPKATKKEGQYFKSWITERERIDALRSSNPVPNWGWVDENPERKNGFEKPRNSVAKVTRYPVNPKTREPIKNQGFNQEYKSLGKTIGERNPGGKLLARAARAFGVVIDALGKFRCPPGTPAANRFTNERGEGCFDFSPEQVIASVATMTSLMQSPTDRATLVSSLLAFGISARDIRQAYKEGGISGLASLARQVGIEYVGDKWNDASYVAQIPVRLREVSELTMGAPERMEEVVRKTKETLDMLANRYGITETDDYKRTLAIIKAMSADPDAPFRADQFELLFHGGTEDSHREEMIKRTILLHAVAINEKMGFGADPELLLDGDDVMVQRVMDSAIDEYNRAKAAGVENALTKFIDASLKREQEYRLGVFENMIVAAHERPETFKSPNGTNTRIYQFDERSSSVFDTGLNAESWPEIIRINSSVAIKGYRDTPPDGYMDLYEATGGDIDDQWRAVANALDKDERLRAYATLWSTDLAATEGRGWRDFGFQTSAHERTHWAQFDAIIQYFRETRPGLDVESLNNGQLMDLVNEFIEKADVSVISDVFGMDIDAIIEKRFDALAGAYSQSEQQRALQALRSGNPEAFNSAKNLALLETLAELNANREIGLIGGNDELDNLLDKLRPLPPSSDTGAVLPDGTPVPTRPDDSPRPSRPSLPDSAPTLPENAGRVVTPGPSGGSGRGRGRGGRGRAEREPVGMFDRVRNGKIPTMIREGRFTNQDIDEFLYGEEYPDRLGGLFGMFRSIRNMRTTTQGSPDPIKIEKKRILNELINTMGVSEGELEAMAIKAKNGETLTPEEKSKLMNAISHLRNGANEFKLKEEDARRRYQEARNNTVDTSLETGDGTDYDDRDTNVRRLERIQKEIEMYKSLSERVGRGLAPAVHDILTINENGPYPDRLGQTRRDTNDIRPIVGIDRDGLDGLVSRQNMNLSDEEKVSLSKAAQSPPRIISIQSDKSREELSSVLKDIDETISAFERNNLKPPNNVADNELIDASPVMSGLDKSVLPMDMVVEIDIDHDSNIEPGSVMEITQITSAKLITDSDMDDDDLSFSNAGLTDISMMSDENDVQTGLASRSGGRVVGAAKLINSRAGRKVIEKMGVDPDKADVVQMMSEIAIGFSIGGPAGAIIPLARRGGRDAGEKALEIMVQRGWIDRALAEKIKRYGIDRIASEGMPDEIMRMAESAKDRLLTDDAKRKAIDMGTTFQERALDLSRSAKEKASEMADIASEKARDLASSFRSRMSRNSESTREIKSIFEHTEIKQLGESIQQKQAKKQKVRVAVPSGSKGKVENGKIKNDKLVMPPGKIKFTGVGEDGTPEAEIVEQTSASQYMKNVEKISSDLFNSSNTPSIKKRAKERAEKAKKMRIEMESKISTPQSMSGISKIVFDNAVGIMERGREYGIDFFTLNAVKSGDSEIQLSEYIDTYVNSLIDSISAYKKSYDKKIFNNSLSPEAARFVRQKTISEIRKEIADTAQLIHNDIDRRARVSMSKTALEKFISDGKISPLGTDSESIKILRKKRDSMLGNVDNLDEYSLTPIEMIHGAFVNAIEKMLYERGTHVGSEEFADYGRGIELVVRAENSPRIGYGRKNSYEDNGIFVQINEDDEKIIEAAIFGQLFVNSPNRESALTEIIEAIVSKDYSPLVRKNNSDIFEAFIVGEITLNDIEHVKIPLSIFNARKKRVPKTNGIGGSDAITNIFNARNLPKEKIKEFFEKEGTIGGGYTPKHLSYLIEMEAAEELKEKLISLGISEVIFTNKDGIDIMAENTWTTPAPTKKTGKAALREIARNEIMSIIDKIAPLPAKEMKKPKQEAKA